MNIQPFLGLIREHEKAHVAHAEAVRANQEHNNQATLTDMLYKGSSASYTGGKLEGFVLALMMILANPVILPDDR